MSSCAKKLIIIAQILFRILFLRYPYWKVCYNNPEYCDSHYLRFSEAMIIRSSFGGTIMIDFDVML